MSGYDKFNSMTSDEQKQVKLDRIAMLKRSLQTFELEKGTKGRILDFYNEIPSLYQRKYLKAFTSNSFKTAIDTKCLDCVCWQPNEVSNCEACTCPLWKYRPYQAK